jgi:hypothetical protein
MFGCIDLRGFRSLQNELLTCILPPTNGETSEVCPCLIIGTMLELLLRLPYFKNNNIQTV